MGLKIIGAGFGRTGTLSTYTALNYLGYTCYHMLEVIQNKGNKSHLDFWNNVAKSPEGQQKNWDEVFSNYTATVDNPACCIWKELLEANPDAKVLLTLHPRGPEAWYDSTINTIYFTESMWQFKVLRLTTPFGRKFGNMSSKLIWGRSHNGTMMNKEDAIAHYLKHIEEVKSTVPPDKLLIFSVDQGWGPLCNFLGVDAPDTDFPNVNNRAEIKKTIAGIVKGAYVILGAGIIACAGLLYGLYQILH